MKEGIHPKYYQDASVTCACGNTFTTGSTMAKITIEICSKCHPFFTGTQKLIDTEGRVDKFAKRMAMAKAADSKKKEAKAKTPLKTPRSLKEMMEMAQESQEE